MASRKNNLISTFFSRGAKETRRVESRRLRLENLENRELLSATTAGEIATIDALTSSAFVADAVSDVQPIDLSNAVESNAVLVVTTGDSDGEGSLRAAIAAANDGDTINFAGDITVSLESQLTIAKSITIDAGENAVTISGAEAKTPIFLVSSGDVAFKGLTIAGGRGFDQTSAGGLMVASGASADVEGCTFTGNTGQYGVVAVQGEATIVDSYFVNNSVAAQGTIYVSNGGDVAVDRTVFTGNSATTGSAMLVGNNSTGSISNSLIYNNSDSASGGATIRAFGSASAYNCTIADNAKHALCGDIVVYNSIILGTVFGAQDVTAYNTLSNGVNWGGGSGNATYNSSLPLFTNQAGKDYSLISKSQAINLGDNNYVSTEFDLAGAGRIAGENVDLGAYEYYEAPSLIVTTSADVVNAGDDLISLREALIYAEENPELGDTITFDASLQGQTITLADGQLEIGLDIAIDATNAGIAVSGGNASRVFSIVGADNAIDVTITGLTIVNGNADDNGGGIYADNANLTITGAIFEGNKSEADGAAIYLNSGSLALTGSEFNNNAATGDGGAIYLNAADSFEISDVKFDHNVAGANGGAIYLNVADSFTATDAIFDGNLAGANGGAIYLKSGSFTTSNSNFKDNVSGYDGGAIFVFTGLLTVSGSDFMGNEATHGGGAIAAVPSQTTASCQVDVVNTTFDTNVAYNRGGAIYASHATLNVEDVDFNENFANSALIKGAAVNGLGGAIYLGTSDAVFTDANFTDNEAANDGGAIYALNANLTIQKDDGTVEFANNTAAQGGAIFQSRVEKGTKGTTTISDATFLGNNATVAGGAYYLGHKSTANISNSTIMENTTDGESGAAFYVHRSTLTLDGSTVAGHGATLGGAIYAYQGTVEIADSTISNNTASTHGGAIYLEQSAATLTGATVTGNIAQKSAGAIYVSSDASATIVGGSYDANEATTNSGGVILAMAGSTVTIGDDAVFERNTAGADGGVLSASSANVSISDAEFAANESVRFGGAVFASGAELIVENATFNNNASYRGGAVYATSGTQMNASSATFENNSSSNDGGAIYLGANSTATFDESTFATNAAGKRGGAIFQTSGEIGVDGVEFANNTATTDGGAIYVGNGTFALTNSTIAGSSAANGGAIYSLKSNVIVDNAEISGNAATTNGGAFYFVKNTVASFNRAKISGNEATGNGGAVYAVASGTFKSNELTFANTLISDNTAVTGSALYSSSGSFVAYSTTIAGNTATAGSAVRAVSGCAGAFYNSIIAANTGDADVYTPGLATLDGSYVLSAFEKWADPTTMIAYDAEQPLFALGGYSLVADSQAVDVGDNSRAQGDVDLNGGTRIVNGTIDLGAFEFQGSSEAALDEAFADLFVEDVDIEL